MTESPYRFYDDIASLYHLVHTDWEATIEREEKLFGDLIRERWPGSRSVLDATCGIGTQVLGLARRPELAVTGSDLSPGAIARARREALTRGVSVELSVCDIRELAAHHAREFDVVLSCDNALPHLLSDVEIRSALEQMLASVGRGGGCVVSMRDYDAEPRGRGLMKPFGTREIEGERWFVFQIWDFDPSPPEAPDHYDFTMYFVPESRPAETRVARSRYYAVSPDRVADLMREAGFRDVERRDDLYVQPLLFGTRP